MWALRPCDYDAPIDLRKKAALQRSNSPPRKKPEGWPPPVANLRPFVSQRYGAQVHSPEREGRALEATIRRLHFNTRIKNKAVKGRSRSSDRASEKRKGRHKRSRSCPPKIPGSSKPKPIPVSPEPQYPAIGGARKRKCFVPTSAEYREDDRRIYHTPPQPYLMHVYDYYQQLVQRLRDHSPVVRRQPPSPILPEEDAHVQRKRPSRALTGKHVKQGTGASISTLLTLRQKIQERQRAREQQPRRDVTPPKKCAVRRPRVGKLHHCHP